MRPTWRSRGGTQVMQSNSSRPLASRAALRRGPRYVDSAKNINAKELSGITSSPCFNYTETGLNSGHRRWLTGHPSASKCLRSRYVSRGVRLTYCMTKFKLFSLSILLYWIMCVYLAYLYYMHLCYLLQYCTFILFVRLVRLAYSSSCFMFSLAATCALPWELWCAYCLGCLARYFGSLRHHIES